jgi:hypothetical protein
VLHNWDLQARKRLAISTALVHLSLPQDQSSPLTQRRITQSIQCFFCRLPEVLFNPKMASETAYLSKEFGVAGDQLHEFICGHGPYVEE